MNDPNNHATRFLRWVRFAAADPEAGADWLAYWREQGVERPECVFYRTDSRWLASELEDRGRQWSHDDVSVTWDLVGIAIAGTLPVPPTVRRS